ncbi:MAG: nucleoside deaminase, partial [Proteobacteria bacterium]|nr:nucleoside deaminase [Pseudomonadota bacterium]
MARDTPSFMALALAEAEAAAARGEVPVGAVLIDGASGEVLAAAGNRTEELHDPTAHAEMLAIRAAAGRLGAARLPGCDLYVTLEPCAMCA